jgi:2-polyprenyl-3-methyl-5-hydroxy-6-metoxy-1,4-benzoquinol methylase
LRRDPTPIVSAKPPSLTNRQRARIIAFRARDQLLSLGVSSGLRSYRPEPLSAQRWERSYTTGEFDYMRDLSELPRYSLLIGYLRMHPGRPSVLDIGCGTGWLRELLAEEDFDSYTGLDLSSEAIRSASSLADQRTSFTVGDAMTIELPAVDVVVLNEMIYYAPSPRDLIRRIATITRPDGMVLSSIWRHAGDRALWRLLDEELELIAASMTRAVNNPYNRRGWRVSCHRVAQRG